jgi:hypothetical protein
VPRGKRDCHETVNSAAARVSRCTATIKLKLMRCASARARLLAVAAVVLAAAALTAIAAPRATAAPGVQYGLTDDSWLVDGPGTVDDRLAELQAIGVRIVRLSLNWNTVAPHSPADATDPDDPAYDWTRDDAALTGLRSLGIEVVLQLVGAPAWANGGHGSNYAPANATTFGQFARAAATRYSWVKRWLIWNEPNQVRWLRPTSPAIYTTRLLNPAYAAIHAEIPGAEVAGGGTAPRGSTNGVSPTTWITGMHAAHAHLDAYAQNPYPLNPKKETPLTGGCDHCTTITMATISRLVSLVKKNFGSARIWLSEWGYQTNPPDKILGVSPALQARYLAEGAYQAWHTPRVDMLIQFLYRDEPDISRFQSGLETLSGAKKPAYFAFQLPLAQVGRTGGTVSLWGQLRAPDAGSTAELQRDTTSGWQTFATLQSSPAGYVKWSGPLLRGTPVRLVAGALTGATLKVD